VPTGIIVDLAREPELVTEKVPEQTKMKLAMLPKLPSTIGTPRKRRMASVLEVVLESVKTPPSSSTEASRSKTEEVPKIITAITSAHAKAGSSEVVLENLRKGAFKRNLRHLESRLEGGVDRRNLKIKTLSPN
jgi:hypothetical protein